MEVEDLSGEDMFFSKPSGVVVTSGFKNLAGDGKSVERDGWKRTCGLWADG